MSYALGKPELLFRGCLHSFGDVFFFIFIFGVVEMLHIEIFSFWFMVGDVFFFFFF
jgi:hypothetical protein